MAEEVSNKPVSFYRTKSEINLTKIIGVEDATSEVAKKKA